MPPLDTVQDVRHSLSSPSPGTSSDSRGCSQDPWLPAGEEGTGWGEGERYHWRALRPIFIVLSPWRWGEDLATEGWTTSWPNGASLLSAGSARIHVHVFSEVYSHKSHLRDGF